MKDREELREVSREQAEEFRRKHQIAIFVETSAKTGENVQMIFLLASKLLYTNNKGKIGQLVSFADDLYTNDCRKKRTKILSRCVNLAKISKLKINAAADLKHIQMNFFVQFFNRSEPILFFR